MGDLLVQMVETLVGDRVLLTCFQQSRLFQGARQVGSDAPVMRQRVVADVLTAWLREEGETAADLGSLIAEAMLRRSRRIVCDMEHWLQSWEVAYHEDSQDPDMATLKRLLAMVNEARRRLSAFESARPGGLGSRAHRLDGVVAPTLEHRIDVLTEHALGRYASLLEAIRADMELVSMDKIAAQAETAEKRAVADGRFQGRLEKVTALLLVPTLIAGIFGANTALPGGGSWSGFDLMLGSMVVTSLAVYVFLVARRGARTSPAGSRAS